MSDLKSGANQPREVLVVVERMHRDVAATDDYCHGVGIVLQERVFAVAEFRDLGAGPRFVIVLAGDFGSQAGQHRVKSGHSSMNTLTCGWPLWGSNQRAAN